MPVIESFQLVGEQSVASRKSVVIHPTIKEALGYDVNDSDGNVIKDWKSRTHRVCKPCWELKYCPYGPFVEQSPLLPVVRSDSEEQIRYFKECIETGLVGSISELDDDDVAEYKAWLNDEDLLVAQAINRLQRDAALETASQLDSDEAKIANWLGGPLPSIQEYRVSFGQEHPSTNERDHTPEFWAKIKKEVSRIRSEYRNAIKDRKYDYRQPLEPARLAWFKKVIAEYDSASHPETIPEIFEDSRCNIFGHICPVFFVAEAITETNEQRKFGRHSIPFATRIRIVRRDNYTCQHCGKHLRDDEVEFDHIIPVSKGGSSEEHNIRLTCFDCNRDKSDKYVP